MTESTLYVVSGAGLSAESGVPTFRAAGGLWEKYDMARVCSARTWKAHREEVYEFYRACRLEVAQKQPCEAHRVLARLQLRFGPERVRLLPQNVDDLLERAGAAQVVHLHGDLQRLLCTACGRYHLVSDEEYLPTTACRHCGSVRGVKPAVVFFGEQAPEYAHLVRMRKHLRREDVVLVVGSSMNVVAPAQFMPTWRSGDARNLQVNLAPTESEWFGTNLAQGASQGLLALEERLTAHLQAKD